MTSCSPIHEIEKKAEAADQAPAERARPTKDEAMDAVKVLLRWAGEDPTREGLLDTPARVVRACYPEYDAFRSALLAHDPARVFRSELSARLGL